MTIPNSVTSIDWGAFSGCTGLTSVTIPNSVTDIAQAAFSGCTGLTSVTIHSSVTNIEYRAFSSCTALKAIEVDPLNPAYSSTEGILFNKAQSVLNAYPAGKPGPYTIPSSVTNIGDYAFSGCTGLTSVTIPKSVTSIGWTAFRGCAGLRAIEVDSLDLAYSSTDGVLFNKAQSVLIEYPAVKGGAYTIPSSVTSIRDWAFSDCTGLTSVTIPDRVTSIGEGAFWNCAGLKSVTIPNRVTSIKSEAFLGCTGLTNATIPASVTFMASDAFVACPALRAIEVDSRNLAYSSGEGVLFNKKQSVLIQYPEGKAGPYTIPISVTEIGRGAFYGCTGLTSVTIPNHVTEIGGVAFSGCARLTSVAIPNSVTFIDAGAFSGCVRLTSVYFEGDAPGTGVDVFFDSAFVTVFYRAGTAGWYFYFAGRPTAIWMPRPTFEDWAVSTGLAAQFPNASADGDDPDGDGFTNGAEWFTATDPTQRASRLELELTPRAADLSESDRTPIEPDQHAVYFRSVPDRYYGVQLATRLGGAWELQGTKIATTTQTRFVLPKPADNAFYRVLALP